jgi:uncharacterized membrane protein YdjX (TVP38/TMEM64 family)
MSKDPMTKFTRIGIPAAAAALMLAVLLLSPSIREEMRRWLALITDREWIRATVESYGWAAPLVFIGVQIAQVVAAPIPGEATGFIGGYVFGTLPGFIYSSVSLGVGSLINFGIGRFLGERFVRRLIPREKFKRIDRIVNRQGIIAVFLMFIIPGFPKDYLSLALGMTTLPIKVFAVLAFIGRMPGTLMLSLQGASVYDRNYFLVAVLGAACLMLVLAAYRWREPLYRWIEKMNLPRNSA